MKLYLFPFAGGASYSYKEFQKSFSTKNIKTVAIELPGRGHRSSESLLYDIEKLADDIFINIREDLSSPFAFYGHSMGTVLCYLVTKRILKEGRRPPLRLFLSGHEGPSVDKNREFFHSLSNSDFVNKLRELGGCPVELLDSEELFNYFEPILRADFQAIETYQHRSGSKLNIPITVMYGTEEKITCDEAMAWNLETTSEVDVYEYTGGHFFIHQHVEAITDLIIKKLTVKDFQLPVL